MYLLLQEHTQICGDDNYQEQVMSLSRSVFTKGSIGITTEKDLKCQNKLCPGMLCSCQEVALVQRMLSVSRVIHCKTLSQPRKYLPYVHCAYIWLPFNTNRSIIYSLFVHLL